MIKLYIIALIVGLYFGLALVWAVVSLPMNLLSGGSIVKLALQSLLWPLTLFRLMFFREKI